MKDYTAANVNSTDFCQHNYVDQGCKEVGPMIDIAAQAEAFGGDANIQAKQHFYCHSLLCLWELFYSTSIKCSFIPIAVFPLGVKYKEYTGVCMLRHS